MKAAIIIQARRGSSRLPDKVLRKYQGRTMLEYLLERTLRSRLPVILAVPRKEVSSFRFLKKIFKQLIIFSGRENDVLDRYYKAAIKYNLQNIIRVTGDNPFTSARALTFLLKKHLTAKADLSWLRGLPYGSGTEIISRRALKLAWQKAADPFEREHLTQYIYRYPKKFTFCTPPAPRAWCAPELRLTVDTNADFSRFKKIIREVQGEKYIPALPKIISYFQSSV